MNRSLVAIFTSLVLGNTALYIDASAPKLWACAVCAHGGCNYDGELSYVDNSPTSHTWSSCVFLDLDWTIFIDQDGCDYNPTLGCNEEVPCTHRWPNAKAIYYGTTGSCTNLEGGNFSWDLPFHASHYATGSPETGSVELTANTWSSWINPPTNTVHCVDNGCTRTGYFRVGVWDEAEPPVEPVYIYDLDLTAKCVPNPAS